MATKYVYFFGNGDADGDESMRAELGGKGANLAQMAKKPLSLPVPPGFTITTDVCQEFYKLGRKYPKDLPAEVDKYLAKLEKAMGKKLGDEKDPLLVSVRSGAAISMPGEGSITTPFDMRVQNGIDRFHLVIDALNNVKTLGDKKSYLIQKMRDTLVYHKQHIDDFGEDIPEVKNWKWHTPENK